MNKCFQILLVSIYVFGTGYSTIYLLRLWGVPISDRLAIYLLTGWGLFCFNSVYFLAGPILTVANVRKPVKVEEDRLNEHFQEVLQSAGVANRFSLLVDEKMDFNAAAIGRRTIIVSRGLIEQAEPDELKAVLAHELGHLQSKDLLLASAFVTAFFMPNVVTKLYRTGMRTASQFLKLSMALLRKIFKPLAFTLPAGLLYWVYSKHLIPALVGTTLFVWIFPFVQRLFVFFWNMSLRFTEYKQDAFAFRLGYGSGLRQALSRLASGGPQSVSQFENMMRGNHPVIYNRIRHLEELEGLR